MSVGFSAPHRTKIALVKVTFDLLIASHYWVVSCILLGLRVTFDMIVPSILMQRLEYLFQIKYATLHWFLSYSSERFQCVHINDVLYPTKVYNTSLLQLDVDAGFCTWPILLIFYRIPLGNFSSQHAINFSATLMIPGLTYLWPGGNTAINPRLV